MTRLRERRGRGASGTAGTRGHTPLYGAVTGAEELDDAFRLRAVLLSVQPKTCLTWPCVRGAPLGFNPKPPPVRFLFNRLKPVEPVEKITKIVKYKL